MREITPAVREPLEALPAAHLLREGVSAPVVAGGAGEAAKEIRPYSAGILTLAAYGRRVAGGRSGSAIGRAVKDGIDIVSCAAVDAVFGPEVLEAVGIFKKGRSRMAQVRRSPVGQGDSL